MSNDENQDRASWHEAGHIVLALHYQLEFGDLKYVDGHPTLKDVDISQNVDHVAQFLVARIAAECMKFKQYDEIGARRDLARLKNLASKELYTRKEFLLKKTIGILQGHKIALKNLRDEIFLSFSECALDFSSEPLVLDRYSIQDIWDHSIEG
jgi:hypothetical protein